MSWRDRLGPARFRGVPFYVDTAERSGGRRGVTHEYPLRDDPYIEDLGRKARAFPIEGYVLGPDYITARDALLDALEAAGPGELVHPYHGVRRVLVTEYRIRETQDEGGVARFSITFSETGKPAQPTAVPDVGGRLRSSAATARAAVGAEFLAQYAPGALLSSVSDSLRSATVSIDGQLSAVAMDAQKRAAFKRRLAEFGAGVGTLVGEPDDLLSEVSALFDLFEDGIAAILPVYSYDPGVRPPAATTNRLQEQTNFDAVQRLMQRLVVVRAAELVIGERFSSYEGAVTARDAVSALIDDQAEVAADDAYPALMQLRADLVHAVPGADSDLAHLLDYTPAETVPSLVLAHRLYGDVSLEADLVARNRVKHPGFIVGGRPLEVLSRG